MRYTYDEDDDCHRFVLNEWDTVILLTLWSAACVAVGSLL